MTLQKIFILAAALLILACSSSSDNKGTTPFIEGTSDSGGGNGVENKAYEAYIVKPENLPAYKNLVAPKVKNILALSPVDTEKALQLFQRWVLYKDWYIAPVSLGTISKDVIGVSFSEDQTEQLALQTKRSIWINSTRFNQMSQEDQATLIIHEMVMSLYYLKFKTWQELEKEKILKSEPIPPEFLEILEEMYPVTSPRPLDSDDYENIRAVTAGFLGEVKFETAKEVDDLLLSKKFDPRFSFTMGMDPNGPRQKFIFDSTATAATDFMKVINTAHLLGRLPNKCSGFKFKNTFDCNFSTRLVEIGGKSARPTFQNALQINSLDPAIPLAWSGITSPNELYHAGRIEFVDFNKRTSLYVLLTNPFPTSFMTGTTFRTVYAAFIEDMSQTNPPSVLLGLISVPGVVLGLDSSKGSRECTYTKPAASSVQTDVILSYSEHLSETEKTLLRSLAVRLGPATSCLL